MNRPANSIGIPPSSFELYEALRLFVDSVIDRFQIFNACHDFPVTAEDRITAALTFFLDSESESSEEKIFKFLNQDNRADIGVHIGRLYNAQSSPKFCWIEAKRLPTPDSPKRDPHEYVYVDHKRNYEGNGGIERFKLNKHGDGLPFAIMIGYIQSGDIDFWHIKINSWLADYSTSPPFSAKEDLMTIPSKAGRFKSTHSRINKAGQFIDDITIYHFWIAV